MTHGTHSGYNLHRQRGEQPCDACREGNRAYHRAYRAANRARMVDGSEARDRIAALEAQGHTLLAIADAAGLAAPHLRRIARGEVRRLTRNVHDRIMAAAPNPRPATDGNRMVPAVGTARRISALRAMGWTLDYLAGRLGMKLQQLHAIQTRRRRVTSATALAVEALYDELAMRVGPSRVLRKRAATKGLVPPLGWDDDIDDPGAWADLGGDAPDLVDPVAVDRLLAGGIDWRDVTQAERLEAARIALTRDGGHAFCAEVLGLRHDAIRRLRQEVAA